jgi:hypothetical protein
VGESSDLAPTIGAINAILLIDYGPLLLNRQYTNVDSAEPSVLDVSPAIQKFHGTEFPESRIFGEFEAGRLVTAENPFFSRYSSVR